MCRFTATAQFLWSILLVVTGPLAAQCTSQWLPGYGIAGTNRGINAAVSWDPDGAGPASPVLVVGGEFSMAGKTFVNNIAAHDPGTGSWAALGAGVGGFSTNIEVCALATLPSGDLVAGGAFTTAGGSPANYIARWDGSTWWPLGSGMNSVVLSLTTLANGDLVAGGWFTTAGGTPAHNIARWDGTTWSALGTGTNGTRVSALTTTPGGDIVAGGNFWFAGGVAANFIARWDGTAWSALGSGMNHEVHSLATLPGGDVVAGGYFFIAGGVTANYIARWDGTAWSALGTGMATPSAQSRVAAFATLPNGDLVAGGLFATAGGVAANNIARWDGSTWSALGSGFDRDLTALATLPSGDLAAAGYFATAGGVPTDHVARWNGTAWSAFGSGLAVAGLSASVAALMPTPGGGFVASGTFRGVGGITANHIAMWDGAAWQSLGLGVAGGPYDTAVYALARLPSGDLVAGGKFTTAGSVAASAIARWNGMAWSAFGSGMLGNGASVVDLVTMPNGDLVAGGSFSSADGVACNNIARWDGSAWSALGAGTNGSVFAIAILPNGDLAIGGDFTTAGGVPVNHIARWNGSAWSAIGSGTTGPFFPSVNELLTLTNGDLVAGGWFTTMGGVASNHIARWNGTNWAPLGSGMNTGRVVGLGYVSKLAELQNGDLVAGGAFLGAGGVVARSIARWNGSAWSAFGSGIHGDVRALALLPAGGLLTGGAFTMAGGNVSLCFARLEPTCPAIAIPIATACVGPAGPVTLIADTMPLVGSTMRSTATGFAPNSFLISLVGFASPNLPLTTLFPSALPNCDQLASTESILLHVPQAGAASYALAIPNDVSFAQVKLFQQFLQFELSAQNQIVSLSGSNGLAIKVGIF